MDKRIIVGLLILGLVSSGFFFLVGTVGLGFSPTYTMPLGFVVGVTCPYIGEA